MEYIRPCGRLETYSTARHHLGFYNNVGLTAHYTTSTTLERPLNEIVFAALHHVIAKHPNLSAVPVHEEKSYPDAYFARLPEIDLNTCIEFYTRETPFSQASGSDPELDQLLRAQHDRSFKGDIKSRPYWRLVIASSPSSPSTFSASFIFHHALSDGSSAPLFHKAFLAGLHAPKDSTHINPIVPTPSSPLLPPLEELHPMTLSWRFFIPALASAFLPSYFSPRPADLWTGSRIADSPGPSSTTTVALPAATTAAFARKCREEGTSVTAALIALFAAVLQSFVAKGSAVKINAPNSLRPFLAIGDDAMVNAVANHVSAFSAPSDVSADTNQSLDWDAARRVRAELVDEVGKRGADNPVALLKYVSDMQKFFLGMVGQERQASAEVSNVGVWRASPAPSTDAGEVVWKIGRVIFSQCASGTGAPIALSAITGPDGCLVLNFNGGGCEGQTVGEVQRVAIAVKESVEQLVG